MRSYLIVTLIPVLCLSLAACEETLVSPNPADTDPVMAEGVSKRKPKPSDFPTVVRFEVNILLLGATRPVTTDPDLLAALLLDERDLLRSDESQVSLAFFGCPDADRVCNELTLVLSGGGTSDRISVQAEPSVQGCLPTTPPGTPVGGCVYDMDLGDRRNAASWFQRVLPSFPLNAVDEEIDGTRIFTLYWQGQRRTIRDNDDGTYDKVWDRYPDLDLVGHPDNFVFFFGRSNDTSGGYFGRTYADCTYGDGMYRPCWAEFHGAGGGSKAYTVWDAFQIGTSNKGRKAKKTFRFELQTFSTDPASFPTNPDGSIDYLDPVVEGASLATWHTVMMTDPSGARSIVRYGGSGVNPGDPEKPGINVSTYSVELSSGEGCYAFRLLDGLVFYDIDKLDYVWDSMNDTKGAKTVWVDTINNTFTVGGTGCPG